MQASFSMKNLLMQFFISTLFLALITYLPASFSNASDYLQSIKDKPELLYHFLKEMPKGGELHYHLAGGAYPEIMLSLAEKGNYCLNTDTFTITRPQGKCDGVYTNTLGHQPDLYHQTIKAWSFKDFSSDKESGHDHFFNSFLKFLPLVEDFESELLVSVIKRAAEQNQQYLEVMLLPDNGKSIAFGSSLKDIKPLEEKRQHLLKDPAFVANIQDTVTHSQNTLQKANQELQCKQNPQTPACELTVNFLYYILREQGPDDFFAQALTAFEAALKSQEIVGINLVQAEDGPLSLSEYKTQMDIINFLHKAYPTVHIALHAGELTPELVSKEHLLFHINDALFNGNAERIGHGVDIPLETDSKTILTTMAKKQIPVEINLTSNKTILAVSGKQHPIHLYLENKVPVVLSTDDEGILRTNLTKQYVEAVIVHGLDYATLKQINRNALTFSFVEGKSLWKNSRYPVRVVACRNLQSNSCKKYIANNPKAALQWKLEVKLQEFEKKYEKLPAKTPPFHAYG